MGLVHKNIIVRIACMKAKIAAIQEEYDII